MNLFARLLATLCALVCTQLYAGNGGGSSLKVSLAPTQAVSSGAKWNVDGGAWRDSGSSATGLSTGSHTVGYKAITGWIAPASTTVTLKNGANTLSATYVNAATLKITLTPTSGQWRVDGGSWQASGATVSGLAPGNHTVNYAAVSGYTSPANETISLTAGQTATLTRSYVQLGQLKITLTPVSGQWRVDGGAWQSSGSTVANLVSGAHVVDYSSLAGYSAPTSESITLAVGQSLALARSYTQLAQISITLVPASGQWRANGGAWQSSGASLFVLPGNYTIEYSALSLYDSPPNDVFALSPGGVFANTRYYVSQKPTLTVALTPTIGQWRIDGGAWQNSGATVAELNVGTHTLDYLDIGGDYAPLSSETISLNLRDHVALSRAYSLKPASLSITLTPDTAQWRVDGGNWQSSGAAVSGLAPGGHIIEYSSIANYDTPVTENVTLSAGQAASYQRSYVPHPGQVVVTLEPTSATWRIYPSNLGSSGTWNVSGATVTGLAAGVYTIEYSAVSGYVSPSNTSITLGIGELRSLTATYQKLASVHVTTNPGTTQWRIDSGPWYMSGSTVDNLAFDVPHTVDFRDLEGYVTPPPQTFTLAVAELREVTATYVQLASIGVILDPAVAQWRLDGGSWNSSGSVVNNLPLGDHTIEYSSLDGFVTPPVESVNLVSGSNPTLTRRYTPGVVLGYRITAIPAPSGKGATGYSINDAGMVAGLTNQFHYLAFRYSNGVLQELGTLGGSDSTAYGINLSGTVVGESYTSGNAAWHAFSNSNGVMQDLGTLGGNSSHAFGINDAGAIVGYSNATNSGPPRAFLFSNGVMQDLGTLGGTYSEAYAINNAGTVVGKAATVGNATSHAFWYSNGVMHDLGTLGAGLSEAVAINDLGVIAGDFHITTGSSATHAFIYDSGGMRDLGTLGGSTSRAYDINNSGKVVGFSFTSNGQSAFIYENGEMKDLNNYTNIQLPWAYGINNQGQILASDGRNSYLLTPDSTLGSIQVSLTSSIGQWRIDGGPWRLSGSTLFSLSPGTHLLEYADTPGYSTPPSETIDLAGGSNPPLFRSYAPLASVTAYFSPSDISAQWRLDGGPWQLPGTTLSNVAYDVSHVVEFSAVPGYGTPPAQTVTATSGQLTTVYALYEPLTGVAQLSVSLSPIRGQWRIDGGEWRDAGAYVTNLSLGEHTIEYLPLPNYVSPPTETVTLTDGHSTFLNRVYQLEATVQYTVTDLGNLGTTDNNVAAAVNLSGMVAGTSHLASGPARAFLYRDGAMQSVGTLGSDLYSFGYGLNDNGDVVGMSYSTANVTRPFVYRNGVMQDLGSLGGATGSSYDITNTGFAVGRSQASATQSYAFIHDGTAMVSLGSLGGTDAIAYAINEGGTIVGAARLLTYHAFRWRNGVMEDLNPLLNADTSYAYDVNEAGTIVGVRFAPGGDFRAFSLSNGGVMQDLGRLGATYSYARGINGAGQVVGNSSTDNGNHAFLHRGAGIEDLNDLVNLPGVVLEFAEDINDLGQIAANGSNGHVYLLTPINAPGGVRVDLTSATGQWRVDGGAWRASGEAVLNLPIGSHTVEFSDVAGYTRPLTETVSVSSGRLLQLTRSYTSM